MAETGEVVEQARMNAGLGIAGSERGQHGFDRLQAGRQIEFAPLAHVMVGRVDVETETAHGRQAHARPQAWLDIGRHDPGRG